MLLSPFLRDGDRVFETYRPTSRGVETMVTSYTPLGLTVYGRQEAWEDSSEEPAYYCLDVDWVS